MRISKASARIATGGVLATLVGGLCVAFGLGFSPRAGALLPPALAFDGTATPNTALLTPNDGSRAVREQRPRPSEKAKELSALQYAADQGHIGAQWKIGRMLADGDGVAQNDLRAFEYFSQIANSHAESRRARRRRISSPTLSSRSAVTTSRAFPIRPSSPTSTVRVRCSSTPRRISATPTRNTNSARLYLDGTPATCTRRRAGSCWRPPRGNAVPKRRLAISCSAANSAAAGRARPDVAHARPRLCRAPMSHGSSRSTTTPSAVPATTNAPWRWSICATG